MAHGKGLGGDMWWKQGTVHIIVTSLNNAHCTVVHYMVQCVPYATPEWFGNAQPKPRPALPLLAVSALNHT